MQIFHQTARDIHYWLRQVKRSPVLATVAVFTLALGIGANTAIFSVLDPLVLQKLPVAHPDELVRVDAAGTLGNIGAWETSSYELFRNEGGSVFSGVMAFGVAVLDNLGYEKRLLSARAETVSANYFSVLGMRPFAGTLSVGPDDLGRTLMLGFDYWQHEFAGDRSVLGKTIVMQDKPFTIVGITPPEFFGMKVGESTDIFLPLAAQDRAVAATGLSLNWSLIVARLKPNVTPIQAQEALTPLLEEIRRASQIPSIEQRQNMERLMMTPVPRGLSQVRARFSLPAQILMAVAALVLLIACSNVASLLLAQGSARRREMAVRLAIGAGRGRLVRQSLTEGIAFSVLSTVAGVFIAKWTSRLIVLSLSDVQTHVVLATPISGRVMLVSIGCAFLCVLFCGLAPIIAATRLDITQALKTSARPMASASSIRLGSFLVLAQVGLSVTALVVGGMLIHSLVNLQTMNVGFDREHIIAVDIAADPARTAQQARQFYDRLEEQVRSLPGVRSVARSSYAPVSGRMLGVNVRADGYNPRPGEEPHAFLNGVTPGYFSTVGIELLHGRDFALEDRSSGVAIINQSLAQHYFAGQDPIGKPLTFVEGGGRVRIIGVVADSKYNDLRETTPDFVYLMQNNQTIRGTLSVRTNGPAAALRKVLLERIRALDPEVRVSRIATMQERIDESLHIERLLAALSGTFSLLSLVLAAVGLYGILAFSVARRTAEIGIRLALGADREDVFRLVLAQGMKLVFAGLVIGAAASLTFSRLLHKVLFAVGPVDPVTLITIASILIAASALACYFPARRATRIDPLMSLRSE